MLLGFALFVGNTSAADLSLQYDSRYVTEGRNNLQQGGIVWLSVGEELADHFTVNLLYGYATSSEVDYDELNIVLEHTSSLGQLDWYVNYTALQFFKDNSSDNEIGVGMTYQLSDSVTPFTDILYSTDAAGFFAETGIRLDKTLTSQWSFSGYILAGFDFGYSSPQYDGHNHSALGAKIYFALNKQMTLSVNFETTQGGKDISRELGTKRNQNWIGLGFSTEF